MAFHLKTALALGVMLAAAPAFAQPIADEGPATVQPEDENENLQWAASVVVVTDLAHQGDVDGKLFGAAGGDPAMNGLNTYLAFFISPPDGWRIFPIGDFLSYTLISESRGRLLIEVTESIMNDNSGEIGSRTRRLTVSWTPGPGRAPPASVTVATAP
jgi:hypothetical protein